MDGGAQAIIGAGAAQALDIIGMAIPWLGNLYNTRAREGLESMAEA